MSRQRPAILTGSLPVSACSELSSWMGQVLQKGSLQPLAQGTVNPAVLYRECHLPPHFQHSTLSPLGLMAVSLASLGCILSWDMSKRVSLWQKDPPGLSTEVGAWGATAQMNSPLSSPIFSCAFQGTWTLPIFSLSWVLEVPALGYRPHRRLVFPGCSASYRVSTCL